MARTNDYRHTRSNTLRRFAIAAALLAASALAWTDAPERPPISAGPSGADAPATTTPLPLASLGLFVILGGIALIAIRRSSGDRLPTQDRRGAETTTARPAPETAAVRMVESAPVPPAAPVGPVSEPAQLRLASVRTDDPAPAAGARSGTESRRAWG